MKRCIILLAMLMIASSAITQTIPTLPWQHIKSYAYGFAVKSNQQNAQVFKTATQQMKLDSMSINIFNYRINEIFVYDGLGRLTEMVLVGPDSMGTMVAESKFVITYDATGKLHIMQAYAWDVASSTWKVEERTTYLYNPSNTINEILWEGWDAGTSAWQNLEKSVYTYDAQNNMLTEIRMEWTSTSWGNVEKFVNNYSSNLKISMVRKFWSSSNWVDSDSTFFAYDGINQLIEEIDFIWLGSVWDKYERTTHHYVMPAKQDSTIVYSWDQMNMYWLPMDMTVSTFDMNGDFDEVISFSYDSFDSLWIANTRESFTYDVNYSFSDLVLPVYAFDAEVPIDQMFNHKLDKDIVEIGTAGNWFPFADIDFYYSVFTPFGLVDFSINDLVIYPNPIADWLTISMPELDAVYTFELYTVSGQRLLTSTIQGKTIINTSNLPHGIYVWQLQPVGGNKAKCMRGKLIK